LPDKPGGSISPAPIDDAYVQKLTSGIKLGRKPKVVLDAGNGAGVRSACALWPPWASSPPPCSATWTATFQPPPRSDRARELTALIERVRAEKADIGLAFDGDGDRLGVVDENGEIIWGDRLLALFAGPIIAAKRAPPSSAT